MSDEGLFPEAEFRAPPAPPERRLTRGEQLRARQAARIATGHHPLSISGTVIHLHPDVPRNPPPFRGDDRDYPRCGDCVFRRTVGGHARNFPKCLLGYVRRPLTEEEIRGNQGTIYRNATHHVEMGPRYSASDASDVKPWWPACAQFERKEPEA